MSIAAILVAVVLAFIVFRFVTGVIKFVLLAGIIILAFYFLAQGGAF